MHTIIRVGKGRNSKLKIVAGSMTDAEYNIRKKEEEYNEKFKKYKEEQKIKKNQRLEYLKNKPNEFKKKYKEAETERNKQFILDRQKTDRITSNNLNYRNFYDKLSTYQYMANNGSFNPNDENDLNKLINDVKYFISLIEDDDELKQKMIDNFNEILPRLQEGYRNQNLQKDTFFPLKKAFTKVAPVFSKLTKFIPVVGNEISDAFDIGNAVVNMDLEGGCKKFNCNCDLEIKPKKNIKKYKKNIKKI